MASLVSPYQGEFSGIRKKEEKDWIDSEDQRAAIFKFCTRLVFNSGF